jgi:integrase/recombinase XerD
MNKDIINIALKEEENDLKVSHDYHSLIDNFISAQDVKETSKETYKRTLKQFFLWISQAEHANPNRETILRYKDHLLKRDLSSLSLSNYMVVVRKFFDWAESMKYYPNIAKGVKGGKRVKGFRKDPLTIEQVKDFLKIDTSTIEGKRDFALLNLMIRTGLRTIEIIRADVGDIRQESGEALLYIQGKGRDCKDEFVVLTTGTLNPIMDYLHARGNITDNDPIFVSLSDRNKGKRLTSRTISFIAKKHLRKIDLDTHRLTAHSLRHTAITLALQAGATLQEAQALGRHANINTTLIYAHNIQRILNAPERKIDALLEHYERS